MKTLGEMLVSIRVKEVTIETIDEQIGGLPSGLSFFDPLLRHEVKETLESNGEVFVSEGSEGNKNGLFIFDNYEETGTIFTQSRQVFDHFYNLKPSSYIFAELEIAELQKELWNIWQLDVDATPSSYRFKHQISMDYDVKEIEQFMTLTQPETHRKWVSVAISNGDKCFVVKIANRIVGIAWISIVDDIARSHSVYVEPQFRRRGIMSDIMQARLLYLKSRHVHTLINEVAESNTASSCHVVKAGEKIVGKMFLYTSPDTQSE